MTRFLDLGHCLNGRYEIGEELGRGGFSIVYSAIDRDLGQNVAVKLLVPPPAAAAKARDRMRREALAVRSLHHPNIIVLYDFLEEGHSSFVVMERLDGGDLRCRVERLGPLQPDEARRSGAQLAEALACAHRGGVLHRDVKAENVLFHPERGAVLTDFGSARVDGECTITSTGQTVGTLATIAPEVQRGARADGRADVFGLGMTLFFALTGRYPESPNAYLPPPPADDGYDPRALRADLPGELAEIVAIATRADPGGRFPTAASLADALRGELALAAPTALEPLVGATRCLCCRRPDLLATAVCPACRVPDAAALDTCLLVEPGLAFEEMQRVETAVTALLDAAAIKPDAELLRGAVRGEKTLLRTSAVVAEELTIELAHRGVPVRSVPVRSLWSVLPASLWALAGANLAAGIALTVGMGPIWGASGLVVAACTIAAGHGFVSRPLVANTKAAASPWPSHVERNLVDTLRSLAPGAARSLLADLGWAARACFVGGRPEVGERAGALLAQACDGARSLAQLDESMALLGKQTTALRSPDASILAALARGESVRDDLVQRLLEGLAGLAAASADAAEPHAAAAELEARTRALDEEGALQRAAAQELEAFLEDDA